MFSFLLHFHFFRQYKCIADVQNNRRWFASRHGANVCNGFIGFSSFNDIFIQNYNNIVRGLLSQNRHTIERCSSGEIRQFWTPGFLQHASKSSSRASSIVASVKVSWRLTLVFTNAPRLDFNPSFTWQSLHCAAARRKMTLRYSIITAGYRWYAVTCRAHRRHSHHLSQV